MAQKLPPPANTKAVLADEWSDTDKETFAPATRVDGKRGVLAEFIAGDRRGVPQLPSSSPRTRGPITTMYVVSPGCGHSFRKTQSGGYGSRLKAGTTTDKARCARLSGTTGRSAFRERLLDHEMTGLAVIAFGKTARFEHLAQLFQHGRAAAHHDPIGLNIQRRQADIVKQLL